MASSVGRLLLSVVVFYTIVAIFNGGLPALVVALGAESVLFALIASATSAADLGKPYSRTALRPMSFGLPLVPLAFGLTALALGDRYFLRFFSGLEDVGKGVAESNRKFLCLPFERRLSLRHLSDKDARAATLAEWLARPESKNFR